MNVSNIVTFALIGAPVLASAILIQPPKKIIESLLDEQTKSLGPIEGHAGRTDQ